MVELLGRYSSQTLWAKRLSDLNRGHMRRSSPPPSVRRVARRLSQRQLADLVAGYEAGATVYSLAERFKIHRVTVSQHLRRMGVTMRNRGLDERQVNHAAVLYQQGWSLARIAEHQNVDAETVRKELRARGVRMRGAHER
jgi:predicted DNA-binding protein YlxM (UPF0122 family)